jgi:hypothetical protein
MNVKKFITGFLKSADLEAEGGEMTATIVAVSEGQYGLEADLSTEWKVGINATNGRKLACAYGVQSTDWHGKEIKLAVGEVTFNGDTKPTIVITPISPALAASERTQPPAPADIDDSIPF